MADLQPMAVTDLSGGENTVASPFALAPNQVQQAVNFVLDEHGSLRVRDGTLIQGVQSPDPTNKIVKIYDLVNVSGATTNVAIIKGSTINRLYNRALNPWTVVGSFSSTYGTPDIVSFVDSAIVANGTADQIRVFSGSNFVVPTPNAPSASHIAVHLGYLWAFNTNTTTTATDGQSSLRASDINTFASWPAASQTFIAKDDGQSGQGLGVFTIAEAGISPTVTIIAFKDFSAYEVSGTFAASNLSVQKIKSDMGCIAPRTIQFISGFGIIRLSHRGFALYDGVNDTLISEEERPRIFGVGQYTGLDWANVSLSMGAQVPNPPQYICACPVSGGTGALSRVFVYDLVRKAWTVLTFANNLATLQLTLDPNVLPSVLGGDAAAGNVRRYFNPSDTTDDGTAISWQLRTKPVMGQSPTDHLYVERLLVDTFGMTDPTVMTATFYWANNRSTMAQTLRNVVASVVQGAAPAVPYGTSGIGGTTVVSYNEVVEFGILGGAVGNDVMVDLSGTGPGRIRAYTWQVRQKPLTRSITSIRQF